MVRNNLPPKPYKNFFGRMESIEKIVESLLDGGIYIASIDGVGGIGKTALAYHFCQEKILNSNRFNYLVWITAKETVFDPFSIDIQTKSVDNKFSGLKTFTYEILKVVGLQEEFSDVDFSKALSFVENEILFSESIFFVLDNLESVNDDDFFKYISVNLNKLSALNPNLKVLTTSRKRKKILDNPIEIEGLKIEDGLQMLNYYAKNVASFPIKDILNGSDYSNIKLLEKVGCIPLGIEFIIGQMSNGKSRGDVIRELEGYPTIDIESTEHERKKAISQIITFSFKDMFETLGENHQNVFKTIAALWKNRNKSDEDVSIDLLLPITDLPISELNDILELLADNKLIKFLPENKFTLTQMAYNFVNQQYEKFSEFENEIIGKSYIIKSNNNKVEPIDLTINNAKHLIDKKEYDKAETSLSNAVDLYIDNYRIYFELAKLQKLQDKYPQANYNFEKALEIAPYDSRIWLEKAEMEEKWNRKNIAINTCEKGIVKTKNDISLVLKLVQLSYYTNCYEIKFSNFIEFYKYYKREGKNENRLKLSKILFNIEVSLIKEDITRKLYLLEILNNIIEVENDIEIKINFLSKVTEICSKNKWEEDTLKFKYQLERLKNNEQILVKEDLKKLAYYLQIKSYDDAKVIALRIIGITQKRDPDIALKALRQLFTIAAEEKDYQRIIFYYEDFEIFTASDNHCRKLYDSSKKRLNELEHDSIIKNILLGLQKAESKLRILILTVLNYDEEKLIEIINSKQPKGESWISNWTFSKNKALNVNAPLIHYSDLSHLIAILSWVKQDFKTKIYLKSDEEKLSLKLKKLIENLNTFFNQHRNESFHSRLPLLEKYQLIEYEVDTVRTLSLIEDIEKLIKPSYANVV